MKTALWVVGTAVVSAAAGAYGGYLYARRVLNAEYEARLEEEIEETRRTYARVYKKDEYSSPESALDALHPGALAAAKALTEYQGKIVTPKARVTKEEFGTDRGPKINYAAAKELVDSGAVDKETVDQVLRNVFEDSALYTLEEQEDFEAMVRNRTEEAPYILSVNEYMLNEHEYNQITLTYYAGDGTLTDDRDDIIEDIDRCVGANNLVYFGSFSGDPNVLYVRNHIKEMEYEITKHHGKYSEVVAGLSG